MGAQRGPHPQQRREQEQPRCRIQHPIWRRRRQHHSQQDHRQLRRRDQHNLRRRKQEHLVVRF